MNQKEKIERIKEFRLIDDVFFEVFVKDIPACQEILRTILEEPELIVNDIIVQNSERNFTVVRSVLMHCVHLAMDLYAI